LIRYEIKISGIVQGVGFRPHIYRLACRNDLKGYVVNTTKGVLIDVEGENDKVRDFIDELRNGNLPPLSKIHSMQIEEAPIIGYKSFIIKESIESEEKQVMISPDISICEDCKQELFNPSDRRFRYAFINCTNCGPRYSIIKSLPYDRVNTTMDEFKMCEECEAEYNDPMNRRFHAQPNACSKCGPNVKLISGGKVIEEGTRAIEETILLLERGYIIAIKGIGGFHLAVDASNDEAVKRLRERKGREEKPFAIMVKDERVASMICKVGELDKHFLLMPQRPIVLLEKNDEVYISDAVAPHNKYFGIFLPYTPLHYLIMGGNYLALVMTSGNLSEEPICKDNEEAIERLAGIADYFLMHNRSIHQRCDDSVIAIVRGMPLVIRRSRGYAPEPIILPYNISPVVATGAHLKNTICLGIGNKAIVSQHIGDLETYESYKFFCETIEHLKGIYSVQPTAIICDMHPNYLSTRYAEEQGLPVIKVQHHEAHIASCMAENHIQEEVIGVAMDGTGYGRDGEIWGSEFFIGKPNEFVRVGHFDYVPMIGGDAAAKEPYRMAIAYLYKYLGLEWIKDKIGFIDLIGKDKINNFIRMIDSKMKWRRTCGCGRLFDAVSALVSHCLVNKYEGQAPVELEMLIGRDDARNNAVYNFDILNGEDGLIISFQKLFNELIEDLISDIGKGYISLKFHNTMVQVIKEVCNKLRIEHKINRVVLSGGCFQNKYLFENTVRELKENGYEVYYHQQVPSNDGGISLGQIYTYLFMEHARDLKK
jgi:hydrogenase maturation protein HypF